MAWIVADSFDYYGVAADMLRSVWDTGTAPQLSTSTRFNKGQSINLIVNSFLNKAVGSNESTIYMACAHFRSGAQSGSTVEPYFVFQDGASIQCTITFMSNGSILLKSGSFSTGTIVATYAGAFAQDVWTHFQFRVVIHNTAGTFTVRKNGSTTDSFSATAINTRAGTTNNYANTVAFAANTGFTTNFFDDILFFSGSGAAPNTWVGDVRAICLPALADTAQKNFTPFPAATGTNGAGTAAGNAIFPPDFVRFTALAATRSGVVTKVTLSHQAAQTGNVQVAIYDNTGAGGQPGSLLGTSAVVTNPVLGANDYTFTGGPSLAQGRTYYVAVNHNIAAGTSPQLQSTTIGSVGYTQSLPYASGFPSLAGSVTSANGQPFGTVTLSGNVFGVSEALANGDTDYVFDATVGDSDLYDLDDLPYVPSAIVGVVSKVQVKKSDAGSRNGQLQVVSGSTTVTGPDTILGSTYTYLARADAVDPATGVAWTAAGVNALKIGPKVTA